MRIVPYIQYGERTDIENDLCNDAFLRLMIESENDRLGENYQYSRLNLDKMEHFNFVFDGDNPVCVSGCQRVSNNVIRVFSRYYAFNKYRTNNNLLDKVDDFIELKYSLERLKDYKLIIWSRDKGAGFFKRLKRYRSDIFGDWEVHSEKIELIHPNNFQSIFYIGDISYIDEVQPII